MSGADATADGRTDGNLATTYALIYSFLISRSHDKAAAAVKKAAKDIVILKNDARSEETALNEIIKWWKLKQEADSKNESSSDSSSDSDSSESSSSSDSSSAKSSKPKANSSSVKVASQEKAKKIAQSTPSSDVEPPPSDSNSDLKGNTTNINSTRGERAATNTKTIKTTVSVGVSNPSIRATKKRRASESGTAIVTAVVTETETPKSYEKANGKQPRKTNTPFRRVKVDEVEFHDDRLKDNAFAARGASSNDYGARASQDLIVTRGDGFRKEKNKKKRGSYHGGEITMQSHSIKFT